MDKYEQLKKYITNLHQFAYDYRHDSYFDDDDEVNQAYWEGVLFAFKKITSEMNKIDNEGTE